MNPSSLLKFVGFYNIYFDTLASTLYHALLIKPQDSVPNIKMAATVTVAKNKYLFPYLKSSLGFSTFILVPWPPPCAMHYESNLADSIFLLVSLAEHYGMYLNTYTQSPTSLCDSQAQVLLPPIVSKPIHDAEAVFHPSSILHWPTSCLHQPTRRLVWFRVHLRSTRNLSPLLHLNLLRFHRV